jgi:hypothetical protein
MAGVRDKDLARFEGWPLGVDNVARETDVSAKALREAVNVDLSPSGKPQRRRGYVRRIEGDVHSAFAAARGQMLAVVDGSLVAIDRHFAQTAIRSDVGSWPISYADIDVSEVIWTNGRHIGRVAHDLSDAPLWPTCPGQPHAAPVTGQGGLAAGTYQVAMTWFDADGRESGSTLAVEVVVPAGGAIQLTNIPANSEATTARVYVTEADGKVLRQALDLPAGTASALVTHGRRGRKLETQWLVPLPPGQLVQIHNGRAYVAAGTALVWSEALRYGLMDPDNRDDQSADITVLEPVGEGAESGLFVATSGRKGRTVYLAGPDARSWQRAIVHPYGAVLGTGLQVPAKALGLDVTGSVPYWIDSRGVPCAGLPGGRVIPLTEGRYMAPQDGERGATLFREHDAMQQIITAMMGGMQNTMRATDSLSTTIRRHGVLID